MTGILSELAGVLGLAFAYALVRAAGPLIERKLGSSIPGGPVASVVDAADLREMLVRARGRHSSRAKSRSR